MVWNPNLALGSLILVLLRPDTVSHVALIRLSRARLKSPTGQASSCNSSSSSSQASTCPTPEQQPKQKIAVAVQVPFILPAQAGLLDKQERLQDGMLQRAQLHICLRQ